MACGALGLSLQRVAARGHWPVDVHPLTPLLHNRPERIASEVEAALHRLRPCYARLVVAYADCGTRGALDDVCARLGVPRLVGAHCYDVLASAELVGALLAAEPGTYLLTDFMVATFGSTVLTGLGLDRYPQLRDDYFRHYRRAVWLAQRPTPALETAARDAASAMGLPLERLDVGEEGLERQVAAALRARRPRSGM